LTSSYPHPGLLSPHIVYRCAQNPNVAHFDSLFDAELESLRGDNYVASRLFDVSAHYAGRRGLIQDQALSHERFGEHLIRLGPAHTSEAAYQIGEAIRLYGDWGAKAKVQLLQQKHEQLLSLPQEIKVQHGQVSELGF
jgi:hypothetical protein